MFAEIAEGKDDYKKVHEQFSEFSKLDAKSGVEQLNLKEYVDRMMEGENDICHIKSESISECTVEQIVDGPVPQVLASTREADVELKETDDDKKQFSKLKDVCKPLTYWRKEKLHDLTVSGVMKDAGVKIAGVVVSTRLTDSPVVAVTSQFRYLAQQEGYEGASFPEQGPSWHDLSQTEIVECEIADPSALVSRFDKLTSKELGVDPGEPFAGDRVAGGQGDRSIWRFGWYGSSRGRQFLDTMEVRRGNQ